MRSKEFTLEVIGQCWWTIPEYLDIQDMKNAKEDEAYQAAYSLYSTRNYPGQKHFATALSEQKRTITSCVNTAYFAQYVSGILTHHMV